MLFMCLVESVVYVCGYNNEPKVDFVNLLNLSSQIAFQISCQHSSVVKLLLTNSQATAGNWLESQIGDSSYHSEAN